MKVKAILSIGYPFCQKEEIIEISDSNLLNLAGASWGEQDPATIKTRQKQYIIDKVAQWADKHITIDFEYVDPETNIPIKTLYSDE